MRSLNVVLVFADSREEMEKVELPGDGTLAVKLV